MDDCDYKALVGGKDADIARVWHFTGNVKDGTLFGYENGFAFSVRDVSLALLPMAAGWYDVCDRTVGEHVLCVGAECISEAMEKAAERPDRIEQWHQRAIAAGRQRDFVQQLAAVCHMHSTREFMADPAQSRPVMIPDAVLKSPYICRAEFLPQTWETQTEGYTTCIDGRPYGIMQDRFGQWEVTDLRTGVRIIRAQPGIMWGMSIRQAIEFLALQGQTMVTHLLEPNLGRLENDMLRFTFRQEMPPGMHLPPEWREWYLDAGLVEGAEQVMI